MTTREFEKNLNEKETPVADLSIISVTMANV